MSSHRRAGLRASAKRSGACLGTSVRVDSDELVSSGRPLRRACERSTKDQWPVKPLIVTAELGACRFRLAQRPAAPAFSGRAQPLAGASHDVPCDSAVCGGRASSDPASQSRSITASRLGCRRHGLGGGVAFRIGSDGLRDIRAEIADRLQGLLTAQDAAGWSAHVTIQNKVPPREAKASIRALGNGFADRPVKITGIGLAPLPGRSVGDAEDVSVPRASSCRRCRRS